MEVTHYYLFGGDMGVKEMENRRQTNFFWQGLHEDGISFCRSRDVFQNTVFRRLVLRAKLEDKPLIDQPFKKVSIDLMGSNVPASDKGHRYILILVDCATRYAKVVPLKSIDTETMVETFLNI